MHGNDKEAYHLILVPVVDREAEVKAAKALNGDKDPLVIEVGGKPMLPLALEKGAALGRLKAGLYDETKKEWTATIAVRRYL